MPRLLRASSIALLLVSPLAACSTEVVTGRAAGGPITTSQVATVSVAPETFLLAIGDTLRLAATTRDLGGSQLTGRVIAWSTASAATATVSATGLVKAVAAGSVRITATSEGRTSFATITVVQ